MLIPTVPLEEFLKRGFKRCKKPYNHCAYLCIAKGIKMIFVSDVHFAVNPWNECDPRIHKNANCRYKDHRDADDIVYGLIKAGMLRSEWEVKK